MEHEDLVVAEQHDSADDKTLIEPHVGSLDVRARERSVLVVHVELLERDARNRRTTHVLPTHQVILHEVGSPPLIHAVGVRSAEPAKSKTQCAAGIGAVLSERLVGDLSYVTGSEQLIGGDGRGRLLGIGGDDEPERGEQRQSGCEAADAQDSLEHDYLQEGNRIFA